VKIERAGGKKDISDKSRAKSPRRAACRRGDTEGGRLQGEEGGKRERESKTLSKRLFGLGAQKEEKKSCNEPTRGPKGRQDGEGGGGGTSRTQKPAP